METKSLRQQQEEHEVYYKVKFEEALFYQDFVVDVLLKELGFAVTQYASRQYQCTVGESRQGVEIKHDWQYAKTGNLFIEVGEKAKPRPGPFAPSGIRRDDNSWLYVIGDYNTIFGYSITILRLLQDSGNYPSFIIDRGTSIGFLLPSHKNDPEKFASFILRPNAAEKIIKFNKEFREQTKAGKELLKALNSDGRQCSLFVEGARNIVSDFQSRKIALRADDGTIELTAPPGVITKADEIIVKANKPELLTLLKEQ